MKAFSGNDDQGTRIILSISIIEARNYELIFTPVRSIFNLWSPTAEDVVLSLYANGVGGNPIKTVSMKKFEGGYWQCEAAEELKGKFYTSKILVEGKFLPETPGIWAKAVG